MEKAPNNTIHPACLQEPPLAMDVIRRKWPTSRWLIGFPYQAARDNNSSVSRVAPQSLPMSLQYSGILFLLGRCLKLQIPVTATVKHVFVTQTLFVSSYPSRDGCVQFQPVHHAQLHVLHFPAALPGAVRLHLHKKLLPQEDHHHLDKRRSTSKNSHLLIYMCVCMCFFFPVC